ncbi:MAG: class I SAM-dependent methyltransferase [Candidatus Kapaibacteriales bacterium]
MSARPTEITDNIYKYILERFSGEDEFLTQLNKEAAEEGFPPIHIAPDQSRFLLFFLKAIGAKTVLEIGSLAGYSAISLARALPDGGKVIALEKFRKNVDFIRRKVTEAGLDDKIEVHDGDARDFLKTFTPEDEIDFVFIDADKRSYKHYVEKITPMLRSGGIICADNALAFGHIASEAPEEERKNVQAIREFNDWMVQNKDYDCSLVTIGDGMLMAVKK